MSILGGNHGIDDAWARPISTFQHMESADDFWMDHIDEIELEDEEELGKLLGQYAPPKET